MELIKLWILCKDTQSAVSMNTKGLPAWKAMHASRKYGNAQAK